MHPWRKRDDLESCLGERSLELGTEWCSKLEGKVGVLLYSEGLARICKGMEMPLKCMTHSVDLETVTNGFVLFSFFFL